MNISRSTFYQLVKMQNHLNNMRLETDGLSDAVKNYLEGSLNELTFDIQALTKTYLDQVDANRLTAEVGSVEYQTETFRAFQSLGLIK